MLEFLKGKSKRKEKIIPQVKRRKEQIGKESGVGPQKKEPEAVGVVKSTPQPSPVRDPGKRQRIAVVAVFIVSVISGLRIWKGEGWSYGNTIAVAAGSAVLSYLGLFWALRFDFKREAFYKILPQPAVFVFSSVLFLELFFFQAFERIYEGILLGFMMLGYTVVLVAVFLTTNILNVGTVKNIPLLRAAHTASYIISLFTVYFLTFSLITSDLSLYLEIPLLFLILIVVVSLHLFQLPLSKDQTRWLSFGISWAALMITLGLLLWPLDMLFISLAPAIVIYIGIGIVMNYIGKTLTFLRVLEFCLLGAGILLVYAFQAKWGIGGYFWM